MCCLFYRIVLVVSVPHSAVCGVVAHAGAHAHSVNVIVAVNVANDVGVADAAVVVVVVGVVAVEHALMQRSLPTNPRLARPRKVTRKRKHQQRHVFMYVWTRTRLKQRALVMKMRMFVLSDFVCSNRHQVHMVSVHFVRHLLSLFWRLVLLYLTSLHINPSTI
jgi:hypothetical protein